METSTISSSPSEKQTWQPEIPNLYWILLPKLWIPSAIGIHRLRLIACVASFSTMGSNCSVRQAPSKCFGQGRKARCLRDVLEKQTPLETQRKSDLGLSRHRLWPVHSWGPWGPWGPTQSMDASQKSNLGFLVTEMCLWSWHATICNLYAQHVRIPWIPASMT